MRKITYLLILLILSAVVSASNIIITPDSMYSKAVELKQVHTANSITSDIINISEISNNYNDNISINITGSDQLTVPYDYNSSLAKKIINYILDNNYDSVTLFGDSSFIPPSYYVYDSEGTDVYDQWIPADLFYTSDSSVGRIPITTEEDADNYIQKLNDWYANSNMDNIALTGSDLNNDGKYYGELISSRIAEEFAGENIQKLYSTKERFRETEITSILQTGNTGLLYLVGHGNTNNFYLEGSYLSSDEIQQLNKGTFQPIVLSSLCSNGAFDTALTGMGKSFGESMIVSESGSIAFIGSSRLSYGLPIISYTDGVMAVEESRYMSELMEEVVELYKDDITVLGDITKNSLKNYENNQGTLDNIDQRTIYEFVLLGDPTLKIPAYTQETTYTKPNLAALNPAIPGAIPLYEKSPITISISTDSPITTTTLIKDSNIIETSTNKPYIFTPNSLGSYLIITENIDSKETRLILNVSENLIEKTYSIDAPAEVNFDESERDLRVEKQFTISNNGNTNLTDITASANNDLVYNISISPQTFNLLVDESITITVNSFIPLYTDSGISRIASLEFENEYFSKKLTLNSNAKSKIEITDIDVHVNDRKRSVSSEDSVIEAEPGDSLKIEIEIANLMEDIDIDSAQITVNISDISYDIDDDEFTSLEDESSTFSISESRDKSGIVTFSIPEIADTGIHDVLIFVDAMDDNSAIHTLESRFLLDIEKEKHNIKITELVFDYNNIDCDSYTELDLELTNIGEEDEDIILTIMNNALGIDIEKDIFLASEIDSDINSYSQTLEINGKNIPAGEYPILVIVERGNELEDNKEITLYVDECPVKEEKETISRYEIEAMHNMEQINQEVYSQTESFKDTSTYKMMISIIAVLWMGFIVFVIGALIIVAGKKR